MIGKISDPRGERVAGLLYYLFGPGRREEHTDPHLIAGWREPAEIEPPLRPDGRRDFRRLTGLLEQPHAALGPRGFSRPVWHCAVRAAPEDRMLSDAEWAQVAAEVMDRTGLSPRGTQDEAVRWIAVRHGADHIHIVAMLARQDGGKPRLSNERYRVRDACLAAEDRYGLRRTAPADRTAASRPGRAESEKAARHGRTEAPRTTLRRTVSAAAAGAGSEQEFFDLLNRSGVLIRRRFSSRDPGEVTGYCVALPADTSQSGGPVWYGGGKLAPDLTLPKLRQRWRPDCDPASDQFTAAERNAAWEHAARAAERAARQLRDVAADEPSVSADAAWAAADMFRAAATASGARCFRRAAEAYDRAARAPYGRIPCRSPAGDGLRRAARLLSAAGHLDGGHAGAQIALIIRLTALAEAVAELRMAQRHAAQRSAAIRAAERLRVVRPGSVPSRARSAPAAQAAPRMVRADFPSPPLRQPAGQPRPSAQASNPRPGRGQAPGRRRSRGP